MIKLKKQNYIVDVEVDENGHDLQCCSGVGLPCDCFRNRKLREASKKELKRRRDEKLKINKKI